MASGFDRPPVAGDQRLDRGRRADHGADVHVVEPVAESHESVLVTVVDDEGVSDRPDGEIGAYGQMAP